MAEGGPPPPRQHPNIPPPARKRGGFFDLNDYETDDGEVESVATQMNFSDMDAFDEQQAMQFNRIDSLDIVYPRKKRHKFVGKFLMGEILGEGSYSVVREALDTETLERRAVKIMKHKRLRKIPNGESNVQREIKLMRKLNHENVVNLDQVIIDKDKQKTYLFMDYCVVVLQDLLEASPTKSFSIWRSHNFFKQMCLGLEYLHSRRIVHKDIKPGNLLLNTQGTIKISDFGVSEMLDIFDNDNYCKHSQGSPAFQPPEIARGDTQYNGFMVDSWAAGVTLFNFTTGKYPFDGDNIYSLFENIATLTVKIPPDGPNELSKELTELILGLLNKDVENRFSIAEALSHSWVLSKHEGEEKIFPHPADRLHPDQRTSVIPFLVHLHYPSCENLNEKKNYLPQPHRDRCIQKLREQYPHHWPKMKPKLVVAARAPSTEPTSTDQDHVSEISFVARSAAIPQTPRHGRAIREQLTKMKRNIVSQFSR